MSYFFTEFINRVLVRVYGVLSVSNKCYRLAALLTFLFCFLLSHFECFLKEFKAMQNC